MSMGYGDSPKSGLGTAVPLQDSPSSHLSTRHFSLDCLCCRGRPILTRIASVRHQYKLALRERLYDFQQPDFPNRQDLIQRGEV